MAAVLILSSVTVVSAATEVEINNSIMMGLEWLANDQEGDGSWPDYYGDEATTGLALLKLCEYAKEQGLDPYDPDYIYSSNVTAGLNYLYSRMSVVDLSLQNHTAGASGMIDDPDSNGNGVGIYMSGYNSYTTGIGLSALSVCGLPERVVNAPNTVVDGMTQAQIAQDMVDWLAYAQSDYNYDYTGDNDCGEGGWYYWALDNSNTVPDNSNTGYAVLGLSYAEDFGSTVPQWVKTELNAFIGCIQDPVNGDENDGGSWYRNIGDTGIFIGTNILKTGNLIFEMAFVGDAPDAQRVTDATDYLARHWDDASGNNQPPGWKGDPAQYQAMFTAMKGLEYMGIDTFDSIDWYQNFSDVIVAQQEADGSWISSSEGRGNPTIITTWALLTLEKSSPETPMISVFVDIKPSSCPNPINTKSKGVLPVAVLGTYDFDVTTIDPASIRIKLDPGTDGVAPVRWNYEDVATPFEGELCDCHDLNGDGFMDLTLKFDTQEVVALTLTDEMGETIPLTITGNLMEEFGGTPIEGQDCVRVLEDKGKKK
ncbi:hypothetical protein GQ472_00275 [archaeon]|nr:hypothetical protein [archaeon]